MAKKRVLFQERDGRKVMSLFGVPCSIPNFVKNKFKGMANILLDFHWDVDRFKHSRCDWHQRGDDYFLQNNIISLTQNLDRVLPSMMYYHWCLSFIEKLTKNRSLSTKAMTNVIAARNLFIDDLKKGVLTSTLVFFGDNRIEHLQGMPANTPGKITVPFELMGKSDYLHNLGPDARNIARAVFGAWQTVVDLDNMYNKLGETGNGIYIWRRNSRGKCAVMFSHSSYGHFDIMASNFTTYMPVRLVVARQSK